MDYVMTGKILFVVAVLSVLLAAVDYINLMEAPLGLGANSWMLVGIALGVFSIAVKQWRSS